jgi:hypothetical protein
MLSYSVGYSETEGHDFRVVVMAFYLVGATRFELVTSSVSGKRSPAELSALEAEAGIEPAYRALQALA